MHLSNVLAAMAQPIAPHFRLVLLSPVYEDAASSLELLRELSVSFARGDVDLRVLLVDDGSKQPLDEELRQSSALPKAAIDVLRLRRNVGHQRAIALGIAYIYENIPCDAVLVMDADGEDRPEDALRLVEHCRRSNLSRIVFAARTRRSESNLFLMLYRLYQSLHWLLTGIRVQVGNFSVVPVRFLSTLVTMPEMWNHYAAAIFQSRLDFEMIPTRRGKRYKGQSKMNYVGLIMHGLQAISVFTHLIAVRMLILIFGLCLTGAWLVFMILAWHLSAQTTLPSWLIGGVAALVFLAFLMVAGFSMVLHVISQRNNLNFIPVRDYKFFIEGISPVTPPA